MDTKRIVPLLLIAALFLFFPSQLPAALQWESIGPPGGDQFDVRIAPNDPNTLFSLGHFAVHRSTDAGSSWQPLEMPEKSLASFYSLAFDPLDSNHMFISTSWRGVWESRDQGNTWEERNQGLPQLQGYEGMYYPVTSLSFDKNGRLFAALGESETYSDEPPPPAWIYRFDMSLESWEADDNGIEVTVPELTQQVGIFLSMDADSQLWAMVYGAGLHRYQDGYWCVQNGDLPEEALLCTFLEHDPSQGGHLLLGTEFSWVYESLDGGESWRPLALPESLVDLEVLPLVYTIVVDPNNGQLIYVQAVDAEGSIEQPIFQPQPGVQVSQGHGFVSVDGGLNWEDTHMIVFRLTPDPGETIVSGSFTRSKIWYATSGGFPNLMKSEDGLMSLEPSNHGLNCIMTNSVWLHPSPLSGYDRMLFGASEAGIFLIGDDPDAWIQHGTPEAYIYTWSFTSDPWDPNILYYAKGNPAWSFTTERGIYRTSLDCLGPNCNLGEQILSDTGVWRVITTDLQADTIYAACQEQGILASYNGGADWTGLNDGLTLPLGITNIILDQEGNPLFASARTSNGNVSADPPQHWLASKDEEGGVYSFDAVEFQWVASPGMTAAVLDLVQDPQNSQRLFAGTVEGVQLTEDGGETWEVVLPYLTVYDLLINPLKPSYLYAATDVGVWRSTDGGVQWHDLSEGLSHKWVFSLGFDEATGILYAGSGGRSVYQLKPVENPQPIICTEPDSLDIGIVPVDFDQDSLLTIRNQGEADLVIEDIVPANPVFTVREFTPPYTITPGGYISLVVRFSPQVEGVVESVLAIKSNDPDFPVFDYPVQGEGRQTVAPVLDVKANEQDGPIDVAFGETVHITANLTANDYLGRNADFWIKLTLPDSTVYWLVHGTGWVASEDPLLCRAVLIQDLAPFVSLDLETLPSGTGQVDFALDDNADGIFDATWSDTVGFTVAPMPPVLVVLPEATDFGQVPVGLDNLMPLTVTNAGEQELTISAMTMGENVFELVDPPSFPLTLNPAEPLALQVRFSPQVEGAVESVLAIESNDPDFPVFDYPVQGEGRQAVAPVLDVKANEQDGPIDVAFGETVHITANLTANDYLGRNADFWIKLTLPDSTVYWLVHETGWVASEDPLLCRAVLIQDLAPFVSLDLETLPSGTGQVDFALDNNADGIFDATWSDTVGFTVAPMPPVLVVLPEATDFGQVPVGLDNLMPLTVTNAGEQELTISAMTMGENVFELVDPPSFPLTLNPAEPLALQVRFSPQAEGVVESVLAIESNDPDFPVFDYPVQGEGLQAVPPVPDVKVNNEDGPVFINEGENVQFSISLDPGNLTGKSYDWWIGAISPYGNFLMFAQTLPLFELPETALFNTTLPAGIWNFFFLLDETPNGTIDDVSQFDFGVVAISP